MNDEVRKLVGVGLAVAVALTALLLLGPKLLGAAAGPEVEILTVLKTAESRGLELDVGLAQPLIATRASYDRVSVAVMGSTRAVVTATLDLDGKAGATEVSSLGAERVIFVLEGGDWEPESGFAPQLQSVVRSLEKRRAALERGDVSGLCSGKADAGEASELTALLEVSRRRLRVERWLIRSERDGVLVTEEWRLTGDLPERPVDDRGARRLLLQGAPGGEFCFPEGLM